MESDFSNIGEMKTVTCCRLGVSLCTCNFYPELKGLLADDGEGGLHRACADQCGEHTHAGFSWRGGRLTSACGSLLADNDDSPGDLQPVGGKPSEDPRSLDRSDRYGYRWSVRLESYNVLFLLEIQQPAIIVRMLRGYLFPVASSCHCMRPFRCETAPALALTNQGISCLIGSGNQSLPLA